MNSDLTTVRFMEFTPTSTVQWTDLRIPSRIGPEKSSYRHVGIARIPVDDNAVSRDLGREAIPSRPVLRLDIFCKITSNDATCDGSSLRDA
jgi:hypothetical protein